MATEFVGIELQLRGEEGVKADLQQIDKLLHSLGGRKKVDAGFQQLKRDIIAARGELEKYQRLRQSYKDAGGKGDAFVKEIQDARYHLRDLQQVQREVTLANRQMGKTFQQTFNSMSSRIAHAGSAMQSLGNAMVRLTSPFQRIVTGALMGVGYQAFGKVSEGLMNGFERADVMRKYPRVISAMFGNTQESADKATESINKLEQAVLGLPTGLDEIVSMSQRFISTTGNIEKGTELAIAANNAFLASMTTEAQRYQGMMQLQDVIGGKDMTAKEWNSLYSSMSGAVRLMGESLGYTGKELDAYAEAVRTGQISNKEFLDTLVKAGADPSGKIRKVAEESMDTWEAFFSRIKTASSNLMYKGIIEPMNELVNTLTGGKFKSVNLLLDDFIYNGINNMRDSIGEWIRSHPEQITEFFKSLKQIDFKSFLAGMAEGMGRLAKIIQGASKWLSDPNFMRGLGRWAVRLNIWGKGLLVFGGVLKGLRAPLAFIGTLAKWGSKGGLLGRLADFIGVGGAGASAGKVADKLDDAVPVLTRTSTGLSRFFKAWGQIATMIGGSAFVAWGSVKLFKGAFKDLKEIGDIIADTDWEHAKWGLIGMGGFIGGLSTLSVVLRNALTGSGGLKTLAAGGILAGLTMMFSGAFWADMEMVKRGMKALSEAVGMINGILDDISNIKQAGSVNKGKIQNAIDAFNLVTRLFNGDVEVDTTKGGTGGGQFSGVSKQIKQKNEGLLRFKKSYKNSLKEIKESLDYMKKIGKLLDQVNKIEFDTTNIQDVADKMGTALGHIGQMIEHIPEALTSDDTKLATEMLKTSMDNVKKTFDTITGKGGLLSQFKSFNKKLQKLVKDKQFTELQTNMDTLATNLSQVWKKLDFVNYAPEGEIPSEADIRAGAAEKFSKGGNLDTSKLTNPTEMIKTQVENLSQAMAEIGNIITTIQEINQVEGLQDALDTVIGENGVISQIQDMYTRLIDTETGFGKGADLNLGEIAGNFSLAIGSIRDAVTTLQEIEGIEFESEGGMSAIVTEITTMIDQLENAFSTEAIGALQAQIDAFKAAIETALQSIVDLGTELVIDASVKLADGFKTSVNAVVSEIDSATSRIKSAWGKIPTSLSKTITITIKYRKNIDSFPSVSIPPGYSHTGGYIGSRGVQYRALGGSIFRKRGSDTVPAMLTPGEYVQNRRAVDFFGIDFMRKVNQLDVRGAMSELMAKAGHMVGASRGTVVNNTYNNNQKVVINGADVSNAGYTFKKASRFVGAL